MSGTGSTFSEFKADAVLPTPITSATSGGEILNAMKSTAMPPAQQHPFALMNGGKKHKSYKKSRRAKHRKSNRKSRRYTRIRR